MKAKNVLKEELYSGRQINNLALLALCYWKKGSRDLSILIVKGPVCKKS